MRRARILAVAAVAVAAVATASLGIIYATGVAAVATATQQAHVGSIGWMTPVQPGSVLGQPGQNRAIEAIKLTELPTGSTISAHVSSIGWMAPVGPGMVAGTTGRGLQMEAVKVTVPSGCTVTYQAYVRGQGWSASVSNGAIAGTTGKALALDGLRVNAVTCATTPPPASVKFAAVGDIGTDSENGSTAASSMLKGLGANGYNFALNLGDLGYNNNPGVEQNYCTFLKNNAGSSLQWLMVPGNHEGTDPTYGGPEGDYRKYVAYCAGSTPPAGVVGNYPYDYYVDRGNVRIIMLSPNISNPTGKLTYRNGTAEQAKLGTWIKGAKSAGKFVVVGAHEPYLTIGAHRLTPNLGCSWLRG